MSDGTETSGGVETVQSILAEMRDAGILGACLMADGVIIASTIAIDDSGSNLITSISNITDTLMKEAGDKQKEIEITIDNLFLVMIPFNNYFLCGMLKDREEKKPLRDYATRISKLL